MEYKDFNKLSEEEKIKYFNSLKFQSLELKPRELRKEIKNLGDIVFNLSDSEKQQINEKGINLDHYMPLRKLVCDVDEIEEEEKDKMLLDMKKNFLEKLFEKKNIKIYCTLCESLIEDTNQCPNCLNDISDISKEYRFLKVEDLLSFVLNFKG